MMILRFISVLIIVNILNRSWPKSIYDQYRDFVIEIGDTILPEMNPQQAYQARLKLSSKLLKFAPLP